MCPTVDNSWLHCQFLFAAWRTVANVLRHPNYDIWWTPVLCCKFVLIDLNDEICISIQYPTPHEANSSILPAEKRWGPTGLSYQCESPFLMRKNWSVIKHDKSGPIIAPSIGFSLNAPVYKSTSTASLQRTNCTVNLSFDYGNDLLVDRFHVSQWISIDCILHCVPGINCR